MRNSKIPQKQLFQQHRLKVDEGFIDDWDYFDEDQANYPLFFHLESLSVN